MICPILRSFNNNEIPKYIATEYSESVKLFIKISRSWGNRKFSRNIRQFKIYIIFSFKFHCTFPFNFKQISHSIQKIFTLVRGWTIKYQKKKKYFVVHLLSFLSLFSFPLQNHKSLVISVKVQWYIVLLDKM